MGGMPTYAGQMMLIATNWFKIRRFLDGVQSPTQRVRRNPSSGFRSEHH